MSTFTNHYLNPNDPIACYRNNPLVGALGPPLTHDECFAKIMNLPTPDQLFANLEPHLKIHAVCDVLEFFVADDCHIKAMQFAEVLGRRTYVRRNPLKHVYQRQRQADLDWLNNGALPPERYEADNFLGSAWLGPPGTGKSATRKKCGALHPRSIKHCYEIEGARYAFTQVPSIAVSLYNTASLKGFAIEFFEAMSRALGDPKLRSEWAVDWCHENEAQPLIYKAALEYNLGMIYVDDSQNIAYSEHGHKRALDYFVRLQNCIGVPVVLVGTDKTKEFLQSDGTYSRRFLSSVPEFTPWKIKATGKDDGMWETVLSLLWQYNYVDPESDFRTVSAELHRHSGGRPDLLVKLFVLTQTLAFGRAKPRIDESLIREAAAKLFYPVARRAPELRGEKEVGFDVEAVSTLMTAEFKKTLNHHLHGLGAEPYFKDISAPPAVVLSSGAGTPTASDDAAKEAIVPPAREKTKLSGPSVLERLKARGILEGSAAC